MSSIYKLLIILCLGGQLAAQDGIVSGRVMDNSTGLGLIGASILVIDSNFGAATDLEGNFSFSLPEGQYELKVSMIGYALQTYDVDVRQDNDVSLSVALESIVLDAKQFVTVQGEQTADPLFQHFQETNNSTTENLIARIEGVNLITRGSYAQEPVIRGMSGGRMNITIDGMKSFGACTDHMDPISSYVEADALNSVEVGKGALSILQGSTVGGSLNMTFVKPQYSTVKQKLWHIKGGFDSQSKERKISFSAKQQSPGSAWALNGAYRKAENYSDAAKTLVPYSGFKKMNLNLGYKRKLNENNQIYLEAITDDAYDIGYAALPMDVGYARMRMLGLSLQSVGLTSELLKLDWKIYGNAIDHWMDDSKREELFMDMHMDMPGFTRTAGSYLDLLFSSGARAKLKLRSEFYWTSSYADMIMYPVNSLAMKMVTWPGVKRWNIGQFAEYQLPLNPLTTLNASLRYDYHQSTATDEMGINELHIYYPENDLKRGDHLFSTNAFLAYNFSPGWQTVFSVALGSRIPTVSESYGYYLYNPVDGYLYLGNPDLPVERSKQVEWSIGLLTLASQVDLTLYYYAFSNYIFGQVMPGESLGYANGWKNYVNSGDASIRGIELALLKRFSSNWTFQGGLSYELGQLVDYDDYLPMIPPLEVHGALKVELSPFWLQLEYKGALGQDRISVTSGENATTAYHILNLKAEYSFSNGIISNFGINNLTNQLYYEHLDWGDIYRPGRSIFLSISINQLLFD